MNASVNWLKIILKKTKVFFLQRKRNALNLSYFQVVMWRFFSLFVALHWHENKHEFRYEAMNKLQQFCYDLYKYSCTMCWLDKIHTFF